MCPIGTTTEQEVRYKIQEIINRHCRSSLPAHHPHTQRAVLLGVGNSSSYFNWKKKYRKKRKGLVGKSLRSPINFILQIRNYLILRKNKSKIQNR